MEYGFHHHVAAEIHYIIEGGQQYHFLDKPSQSVYSDGYILIPCGCVHSTSLLEKNTKKFVVGFRIESPYESLRTIWQYTDQSSCAARKSAVVANIMQPIYLLSKNPDFNYAQSAKYIVGAFVMSALENEVLSSGTHDFTLENRNSKSDLRMDAINAYIDEHIFGDISCEDIAEHIGLHIGQANRICKKYTNCTIKQHMTNRRMEVIKEYLETKDFSLTYISELAGFSSVYSFIRHFHKQTGITPGKYRKTAEKR